MNFRPYSVHGRVVRGRNVPGFNLNVPYDAQDFDPFGAGLIRPASPINYIGQSEHKFSNKIIIA